MNNLIDKAQASTDNATLAALEQAKKANIETVWDRYQAQLP